VECGKQQFLFKLQMVDQPIFNPRMTVQEVITVLNKEFGWKSTAGNRAIYIPIPTGSTHATADQAGKNPVRWSLK
jgi:hypothetical protein